MVEHRTEVLRCDRLALRLRKVAPAELQHVVARSVATKPASASQVWVQSQSAQINPRINRAARIGYPTRKFEALSPVGATPAMSIAPPPESASSEPPWPSLCSALYAALAVA